MRLTTHLGQMVVFAIPAHDLDSVLMDHENQFESKPFWKTKRPKQIMLELFDLIIIITDVNTQQSISDYDS